MMKAIFLLLFCSLFLAKAFAQQEVSIGLGGNAYVTKSEKEGQRRSRIRITDKGIENWTNATDVVSVYFRIEKTQALDVALLGNGHSRVRVSYKNQSHLTALQSDEVRIVPVGKFDIPETGYVQIDLQGISTTGESFGSIQALVLKNPQGNITYVHDFANYWGRRGPSIHMGYKLPEDKTCEWFYNEVTVPEEGDVIGSYYMANGFNGGYFGIQHNSPVEKRVLFSVWSPFRTDDPTQIPADMQFKTLRQGEGVKIGQFGNEGSGGQSYLIYDWQSGKTYKFLTQIRPDGKGNTVFTAYFYATDENRWRLIASFLRPKTDTWQKRVHSFLENFNPVQGFLTRSVEFGNQWALDTDGKWHELTTGTFTYDNTARAGVRLDYQGGLLENNRFYLKNGGFFNTSTKYQSIFQRKATGNQPEIDFENLKNL